MDRGKNKSKELQEALFLIYLMVGIPTKDFMEVLSNRLNNGKELTPHFLMIDKEMENKLFGPKGEDGNHLAQFTKSLIYQHKMNKQKCAV